MPTYKTIRFVLMLTMSTKLWQQADYSCIWNSIICTLESVQWSVLHEERTGMVFESFLICFVGLGRAEVTPPPHWSHVWNIKSPSPRLCTEGQHSMASTPCHTSQANWGAAISSHPQCQRWIKTNAVFPGWIFPSHGDPATWKWSTRLFLLTNKTPCLN